MLFDTTKSLVNRINIPINLPENPRENIENIHINCINISRIFCGLLKT